MDRSLCRFAKFSLVFAIATATSTAQAAVAVLGPGPAAICFEVANVGAGLVEGLKACNEALASNLTMQDRFATLINRGVISYALKDKTSAMADFNAGIDLQPANGDGYIDRGLALAAESQFSAAVQDFNKGIELAAHNAYLGFYNRAIIEELAGDIAGAYRDYKQALALEPKFQLAADQLKRFRVTGSPGGDAVSSPPPGRILFR